MRDDDKIMPAALKDIAKKFASKLIHGQVFDLTSTPAPSYIHHYVSQIGILKNDFSNARYLYDAAKLTDARARMKEVLRFALSTNWINPTLIGLRAPLTPIMGETYQREMEDGTRFYVE